MTQGKTVIVSLTQQGNDLAQRVSLILEDAEHWHKPNPFKSKVQGAFNNGSRMLFICATGIVVRTLSPVLKDKWTDPPVLVLDESGQYVIPLLSGHEGGANQWAVELAERLGVKAVITTQAPYTEQPYPADVGTEYMYTVGMGCERHCSHEELAALLSDTLRRAKMPMSRIQSINSINIKKDEAGLISLAASLALPFQTFSADAMRAVEPLLSVRSDYVYNTVGVFGVAESAALFAAQFATKSPPELWVSKQKSKRATCSVARAIVMKKDEVFNEEINL